MTSGVAKNASRQMERRIALQEQSRILETFYTHTMTPLVFPDRHFNFIQVNKAIFRDVVQTKIPYRADAKPFCFPDHPEWGVTYWDWTLVPLCNTNGEVAIDSQRGGGTRVTVPLLTAETGTAG